MKYFFSIIVSLLIAHSHLLAQEQPRVSQALDHVTGFGIGNKSHFGNFGFSSNLFLNKGLSLKLSAGVGAFNYGGTVLSAGAEQQLVRLRNHPLSLGGVYAYNAEGSDILGDDDSDDYVWWCSTYAHNLKAYLCYAIDFDGAVLKIEAGYSHALTEASYAFSGPGTATQKQHKDVQRGLGSGWMASVYINYWGSLKKKKG